MSAKVRALRGATTIDEDTPSHIQERVASLLTAMFERNEIDIDDVVSIFFSATADIRSTFPATGARAAYAGLSDTPLINMTELDVVGALASCVRVMAHVYTDRSKAALEHVYLQGAVSLRPDLAKTS